MGTRLSIMLGVVALVFVCSRPVLGDAPHSISYQGFLTGNSGVAVDSVVSMSFAIYDDVLLGDIKWAETHSTVSVTSGLFSVLLGEFNSIPDSVFNGSERFLGISVGGDPELYPRTPLVSVGYSFRVSSLDGAVGGVVQGNLAVEDKVTIGPEHTNSGSNSFVAGKGNTATGPNGTVTGIYNTATGDNAVVGGSENTVVGHNNTIGGGHGNYTERYSTTVGGGWDNEAIYDDAAVLGGARNSASGHSSCIMGGESNKADGSASAVAGGNSDTANGHFSIALGGRSNYADGDYSLAAGRRARAMHDGAFVLADSIDADFESSAANQFAVRATGGIRFITAVDGSGSPTAGVQVAPGGGSWSSVSDRELKENFRVVNGEDILAKISSLPITTWNYKSQDDSIRHIGPTAQDFYAAFEVGDDSRRITTIDPDGVALAAIQALYERTRLLEQNRREIVALKAQLDQLNAQLQKLLADQ